MIGLVGKNKSKITYRTPGRLPSQRAMSFFFFSQVNYFQDIAANGSAYVAGFLQTSEGLGPDEIKITDAINPNHTAELNRIRLNILTTPEQRFHKTNYPIDTFLGRAGARFSTIYRRLATDEINPKTLMEFHIHRPDTFKYISIEDTGSGGGGETLDNAMGVGTIDFKEYVNCNFFYMGKCAFEEIVLPPNLEQLQINRSFLLEKLKNLGTARLVFIANVTSLSELDPLSDEMYSCTIGNNTILDLKDYFVGKTQLRTLALHQRNNNNIVPPFEPSNWTGTLDLSDCSSLESFGVNAFDGTNYKAVSYPSLSNLKHYKISGDISLTDAKFEEMLTPNLEYFLFWNGLQSQVTQGVFTTAKTPNLVDVYFNSTLGDFTFDFANHQNVRDFRVLATPSSNIDLSNSSVTDIRLSGNGAGTYDFSNMTNCNLLAISNIPFERIDTTQLQNIEQTTSIEWLDFRSNTSGLGINNNIDLSLLINMDVLILSNTGILNTVTLPLRTEFRLIQVYDNLSVTTLQNFNQVRRITGGNSIFIRNTNLNLDFSNLLQINTIVLQNTPVQNVDLSNIDTPSIGQVQCNSCSSLITLTLPNIQSIGQTLSLSASSVQNIVNLDKFKCLENNQNYVISFVSCFNLDFTLPFNDYFILPKGGLSIQNCNFSQTNIDQTINNLWDNRNFQISGRTLNISGGTNAVPSGVYQASANPSTPMEKVYDLVVNFGLTIITN